MDDPAASASAKSALANPSAHGEAALLLVESLLHALVARSLFTPEEAAEIVEVAADVSDITANEASHQPVSPQTARWLLDAIGTSLLHDQPKL